MGLFENFNNSDNSKFIFESLDKSIQKLIIDKFPKDIIIKKYNLNEEEVDIDYWYKIILDRVRIDKELSEISKKNEDIETKVANNIWGHADEYAKKHLNKNLDYKKRICLMRIVSYGHIYSSLLKYNKNISGDSFVEYLKKENINNDDYQKDMRLRVAHAKASVYGTIKYALISNIQLNEIKQWFPLFEFDAQLIEGNNPLDSAIQEIIKGNSEIAKKMKIIFDKNKRIQVYELSEDKRKEVPLWFISPFYENSGVVKSLLTNKEFELNYIEKSIFTEIQYNTLIIEEFTKKASDSRELFENHPHLKYMVDVVDLGTEWFKKNNTDAYKQLFENISDDGNQDLENNINEKFCGECGALVSETKFCGECGKSLTKTVLEKNKIQNDFIQDSEEQLNKRLNSISEDWCKIINSRASWRTMSIKTLSFSYWDMASGHSEEYMLKYKEGQMDIEGISYRIEVINSFIDEYEKYFKFCIDSKNKVNDEVNNRFLAIVESLIGAELTLLKMVEAGESFDLLKIYERLDKPNSETIKDVNHSNTDLVDILEYSYYKGYIFNGFCNDYNEKDLLLQETPFRYGLKHGTGIDYHENGSIKQKLEYFNDKLIARSEFDLEGKLIKDDKNTKNENSELSVDKASDKVLANKFSENIDKLEVFSNFTDIQIRNSQLTVFISAIWQLINADGELSKEESSQFLDFAKKMSEKFLGNEEDINDPIIAELLHDADKMIDVIKTFPEQELETFWSTLFSFALADGDFSLEEANLIGVIAGNVYEDLSDDEVRNWITEQIKKQK